MSKFIDRLKKIYQGAKTYFDEGEDLESPDSLKDMAIALSSGTSTSPAEIQKILAEGKERPEQDWLRNFGNLRTRKIKQVNPQGKINQQSKNEGMTKQRSKGEVSKEEPNRDGR